VKRWPLPLLLGACAGWLLGQPRPAPLDEAGYQKVLAAGKGQVLLVDFWATWCEPCRLELPQLVGLDAKYRSRGFKLVTVSADEPEQELDAAGFLQQHRVPGPAYIKRVGNDEKFIDSVDPKWSGALPALFLYDRQGRKVKSYIGETDMAALEAAIRKLLEN
jgi:thiol-disulfide isomerase/thioredoxin